MLARVSKTFEIKFVPWSEINIAGRLTAYITFSVKALITSFTLASLTTDKKPNLLELHWIEWIHLLPDSSHGFSLTKSIDITTNGFQGVVVINIGNFVFILVNF